MQRERKQNGYVYRRAGFWVLRYRVRVMEEGKLKTVQRAKQLAPIDAQHKTKASVRQLAEDVLKPMNERLYSPETVATIGQFVEGVYLPHIKQQKRLSTHKGYRDIWNNHLKARCSEWWMREIRTCDVQRLLEAIAMNGEDHPHLSRTSLKHIKALLSGILNHAKQQGFFDGVNPVQGTAIPKAPAGEETYAYSLEEISQMLVRLPEPAATVVATAAFTGLRRGEIQGLLWESYDGQQMQVQRSIWNGIAAEPKTAKSKAPVPVIPRLKVMLDAHRERSKTATGPMFVNQAGKPVCLNNLLRRSILPALQRCAVCHESRTAHDNDNHEYKPDTSLPQWHGWHAFRRGLATNLHRLGVDDKTIQAILRHSNLATTMNIYVKTVSADSVAAMNALDSFLTCANRAPEQQDTTPVAMN
jgi:integrase